jgi:hypothetical protein
MTDFETTERNRRERDEIETSPDFSGRSHAMTDAEAARMENRINEHIEAEVSAAREFVMEVLAHALAQWRAEMTDDIKTLIDKTVGKVDAEVGRLRAEIKFRTDDAIERKDGGEVIDWPALKKMQ